MFGAHAVTGSSDPVDFAITWLLIYCRLWQFAQTLGATVGISRPSQCDTPLDYNNNIINHLFLRTLIKDYNGYYIKNKLFSLTISAFTECKVPVRVAF
jgi:hypothetical protein